MSFFERKVICKWLKSRIRIISCQVLGLEIKKQLTEVQKGQSPTACLPYKQVSPSGVCTPPNPACCLFLYDPWTNNSVYIFKWLGEKNPGSRILFYDMWKLYEIQVLVSVNKALLEYSHSYFLHIVYGCFQAIVAELGSCIRDVRAQKAKNIYFVTLYRIG